MKALAIAACSLLFAGCGDQAEPPHPIDHEAAKEVFRRAFWKRPSSNDKILHAERREWTGVDGQLQWQWFLVVEPSPELVKHLRDDNAFSLVAAAAVPSPREAPSWFVCPTENVAVLRAPRGSNLCLVFSKSNTLLHASDAGSGFRPGAP